MGIVPADATAPGGDADVLVVGYGPVGQTLAILLAQQGWQVTAVEKWPTPFERPRAICFDRHAGRLLGATGVADAADAVGEPIKDYIITNAEGKPLMRADLGHDVRHRWPDTTTIYQPGLEAALEERGTHLPTLRLLRGQEAVGLNETGDRVEVTLKDHTTGEHRTLRARWVVGCDGANSFVREHIGSTLIDGGYASDWMACDVIARGHEGFPPGNTQVADPARPRADLSAGPGHRRWEFMRLPDEPLDQFDTRDNAWAMLTHFGVDPDNAVLERHATYTCYARNADIWHAGRIFLAGDSAHQMPPFAGQGMCGGLRDAANLAWRLNLVLAGTAATTILDTYQTERRPEVQRAIDLSVLLGRVIDMTDPDLVPKRDDVLMAILAEPQDTPDPDDLAQPSDDTLANGFFDHTRPPQPHGPAWLAPQARTGRTATDVHPHHADDLCGHHFTLLSLTDPTTLITPDLLPELQKIGIRLIHLLPPTETATTPDTTVDADGTYTDWLTNTVGATTALVRPDFQVYGTATGPDQTTTMLRAMLDRLA